MVNFVYGVSLMEGRWRVVMPQQDNWCGKRAFFQRFWGKMHSGWGYSESPLIDGELLICTPGSADAIPPLSTKKPAPWYGRPKCLQKQATKVATEQVIPRL